VTRNWPLATLSRGLTNGRFEATVSTHLVGYCPATFVICTVKTLSVRQALGNSMYIDVVFFNRRETMPSRAPCLPIYQG
jgi:hypothetical protein